MSAAFWIGNFQLGDTLSFAVASRDIVGSVEATFVPTHYDVINCETQSAVDSDVAMEAISNYGSDIFVPDNAALITLSTGNGYAENTNYMVVVKEGSGTSPTVFKVMNFRIDNSFSIEEDTESLYDVEVSDLTIEGTDTIDDTVVGRLMTLERNHQNIIFPRLKRLLGLLGEHQVADGFLYDDDGNISTCRIRLFDTAANAAAASQWTDRVNDSDPAATLDTGELARYTINATHLLPANLRTLYTQAISSDQNDNAYIDESDGSWPL